MIEIKMRPIARGRNLAGRFFVAIGQERQRPGTCLARSRHPSARDS